MKLWEIESFPRPSKQKFIVTRDTDGFARSLKKGWVLEIIPMTMDGVITMYAYENGEMVDGAEDYDIGYLRQLQKEGSVKLHEGIIFELLDQPVEWDWKKRSPGFWKASFSINDDTFEVYFSIHPGRTDLTFSSEEHGEGISGQGDQFKIFSTVGKIVEDFLRQNKTEVLIFSAKEPSRVRLYHRFAKMISREFDFEIEIKEGTRWGTEFILYSNHSDRINEEGVIVPNVNTTIDVKPGETQRQAAKFGNHLDGQGRPPLLSGSYGDSSARFSANQGDPQYGPNGSKLKREQPPR